MAKTFSDNELRLMAQDVLSTGTLHTRDVASRKSLEILEALAGMSAPQPQPASGDAVTHEMARQAVAHLRPVERATMMMAYIRQQSTKEPRA